MLIFSVHEMSSFSKKVSTRCHWPRNVSIPLQMLTHDLFLDRLMRYRNHPSISKQQLYIIFSFYRQGIHFLILVQIYFCIYTYMSLICWKVFLLAVQRFFWFCPKKPNKPELQEIYKKNFGRQKLFWTSLMLFLNNSKFSWTSKRNCESRWHRHQAERAGSALY